jgi:ribonuclease D
LDIQLLLASEKEKALPGLQKCVSKFSDMPLSKIEQCSEWGNRPLRSSQLEYAGLDAAILLVLLSEEGRRQQQQRRQVSLPDG